jgi:hypothetical protein
LLSGFAALQSLLFLLLISTKLKFPSQGVFFPAAIEFFITILLGAVTAIMLGLFLSSIAPNSNTVVYLILGVLFIQILFAGVLFEVPGAASYLSKLTLTRWTTEALGISANLEHLDSLTRTRFQPDEVTTDVEVEIAPGQTTTQLVTVQPEPVEISTSSEFELNYEHSPSQLLGDWGKLIGLSLLFGAVTIWMMKRKDVV